MIEQTPYNVNKIKNNQLIYNTAPGYVMSSPVITGSWYVTRSHEKVSYVGVIICEVLIQYESTSSSSCRSPVGHTVTPVFKTKCAVLSSFSCGPYSLTCSGVSIVQTVCLRLL